jgi:hypothetical protein
MLTLHNDYLAHWDERVLQELGKHFSDAGLPFLTSSSSHFPLPRSLLFKRLQVV